MNASLRDAAQMVLEAWQTSVYGDERHHKAMLLAMTTLCAAISLPDKPVAIIPAGYKLVPMEPTPEMVDAAFAGKVEDQDVMRQLGRRRAMRADYAAMLDATPQPAPVQQKPEDFDTWAKNPYTLVLQKSIAEDYVPRHDAPVERKPLTVSDAEKAFHTWNLSGASEETDAFYRLNSAGKLECAFIDGLRAGEAAHGIKGAA